jgi:hypothetical protein
VHRSVPPWIGILAESSRAAEAKVLRKVVVLFHRLTTISQIENGGKNSSAILRFLLFELGSSQNSSQFDFPSRVDFVNPHIE